MIVICAIVGVDLIVSVSETVIVIACVTVSVSGVRRISIWRTSMRMKHHRQ